MAELLEKLSILEKDQTNSLGINSERTLKTCKLVREAILLLSRCYDIFPRQISFSFNGGKDSTVVLLSLVGEAAVVLELLELELLLVLAGITSFPLVDLLVGQLTVRQQQHSRQHLTQVKIPQRLEIQLKLPLQRLTQVQIQ